MTRHPHRDERELGFRTWARAAAVYNREGDPFACYIAFWIAITIKAADHDGHFGSRDFLPSEKRDADLVRSLCEYEHGLVNGVLKEHPDEVAWLAQRRGTTQGTPILDSTLHDPLYTDLRNLSGWWLAGIVGQNGEPEAAAFANLLNRVRNNLFHGGKVYETGSEDGKLLEALNPIMLGLLDRLAETVW